MTVKPIRTEADYEAGLAQVALLMDAAPGSADADALEVLSTLIERYEDEHFSIEAPTPLAAIQFRMEQEGLSPRDLEPYIGSRARVSEVLSGARPLSIDMIRALHENLGIPAESLIKAEAPIESKPRVLARPAARKLTNWGILKEREPIDALFARAFGGETALAMLRKTRTTRANAKTDLVAVQAWCAAVLLQSVRVTVSRPFNASAIDDALFISLARLSANDDGPQRVEQLLSDAGIAFVVFPHLPGTHIDGAAMLRSDGTPVIGLTVRRDRIDNFWFTLFHELAHVRLHLGQCGADLIILDDLEIESAEQIERQADEMAGEMLIASKQWAQFYNTAFTSLSQVVEFAGQLGIHPAIVAGRWQRENRDYRKFSKVLGHGTVRPQFTNPA